MIIKIDFREDDLIKKMESFLLNEAHKQRTDGIKLERVNLPLGDIVICDDLYLEKIIIERKTFADLSSSIRDGRYDEQSFRLNAADLPNHNIIYLLEGSVYTYKAFKSNIDKYALMSSMITLNHFKGFSIYRTISTDETAEYIIQLAYKLNKEKCEPYYTNKKIDTVGEGPPCIDSGVNYSEAIKRTKKNNITLGNIGEIMLSQIPSVSSSVSIAVMIKYKTIQNLINCLNADKTCLNCLTTNDKNGKARKISKTSISNIIKFLVQ